MRFLTEEVPQTTARISSVSSGAQNIGNSQSYSTALEHWNPSAILGRDGSASVLKDTKTLLQRKGSAQNHATTDGLPISMKPTIINTQSSPSRFVVPLSCLNINTNRKPQGTFLPYRAVTLIQLFPWSGGGSRMGSQTPLMGNTVFLYLLVLGDLIKNQKTSQIHRYTLSHINGRICKQELRFINGMESSPMLNMTT